MLATLGLGAITAYMLLPGSARASMNQPAFLRARQQWMATYAPGGKSPAQQSGANVAPPLLPPGHKLVVAFDESRDLIEGRCAVLRDGKWGFADKNGDVVVPLTYDRVCDFSEGLAVVWINDRCGYIDYENNIVVSLDFVFATDFKSGRATVGTPSLYDRFLGHYVDDGLRPHDFAIDHTGSITKSK
ncbi:MAG: WG repeat-containing protein [Phycisphaerales bacterium]|nr:WG repeat-containing protein [Phycisphaerales bacterium]